MCPVQSSPERIVAWLVVVNKQTTVPGAKWTRVVELCGVHFTDFLDALLRVPPQQRPFSCGITAPLPG